MKKRLPIQTKDKVQKNFIFILMLMLFGMVMPVVAQDDCVSNSVKTRTFMFYLDEGSGYALSTVTVVKDGETLHHPEFDVQDHCTFSGWHTVSNAEDFSSANLFEDFTTQTVTTSDTVELYSTLTCNVYHVIFMSSAADGARVFRVWERLAGDEDLNPDNETVYVDAETKSVGWYYDQALTQRATSFTMPSQDIYLYPDIQSGHWLIFESVGGTYVEPEFVQAGDNSYKPSNPTRVGYEFQGWDNGSTPFYRVTGSPNLFGNQLTEDLTLTAVWSPSNVNYTVVYWVENPDDANYSFNNVRTDTASASSQITTLTSEYTATTNIIDGLSQYVTTFSYDKNTQADATDVTVAGDGSTVINLYFKRKTYTLTFDPSKYYLNNSTSSNNNQSTTGQSSEVITAKYGANIWSHFPITKNLRYRSGIFSYTNVNISMWKASNTSVYSYPLQTISTMPGANVTFYLYYNGNETEHTIYYALENLEGTGFDTTTVTTHFNFVTYTEEYCDIQGFTKQTESEAGFGTITHGSSTFDHAKDFGADGTVTLIYYRNPYHLKFNNNGTEMTSIAETRKYEQPIGVLPELTSAEAPVGKEGFTFGGWYENEYCEGDPIDATSTMPAADVMLYAKWIAPDYTATIHHTPTADGATNVITVHYGDLVPSEVLESVTPCSNDEHAMGWKIVNPDATQSTFSADMRVFRDITLVPLCYLTGETFTITYNMDCEGAPAVQDPATYAHSSNPMVLAPSVEVCTTDKFLGWVDEDNVLHYPYNGVYMTKNYVLTALWGTGTESSHVEMDEIHPENGAVTATLEVVTNGTTLLTLPESFERPTRPNDLFIGWSTTEHATMPDFAPGESVVLSCDVSIYPVWMQINPDMTSRSVCEETDVDLKTLVTYSIENDAYTFGTEENIQDSTWVITKDGAAFTTPADLVISSIEAGEYEVNLTLTTTKGVEHTITTTITAFSSNINPTFPSLQTTICQGYSVDLPMGSEEIPATGTDPAIPSVMGAWMYADGLGSITEVTRVPTENVGNVTITFVPDAGQCANDANIIFTIVAPPTVTITGESTICDGGSISLTANVDPATSATYQWFEFAEADKWREITGATDATLDVTDASSYKVKVTAAGGCVVNSGEFEVTAAATPVITVTGQTEITYGESVNITVSCANGTLTAPDAADIPSGLAVNVTTNPNEMVINGTPNANTTAYNLIFTGTSECGEVSKTVEITVNALDVTVTVVGTQNTTVYDGEFHDAIGYTITCENPLYDVNTDVAFYCNANVARLNVGKDYMSLGETCFENTNDNFNVTFDVTDGYQEITAREVTVSVEDKVVTFNGVEQYGNTEYTFTNLVSGHDATITYTPSHGTAASTTPYDNGEFSGGFQVMNGSTDVTGNYTLVTQTAGKLTITAPDAVVVTITGNYTTVDYDGAEHDASGYTVSISNPSYTADDFSFSGTDYVARTDAGTTYMELEGKFENQNPAFTDVTFVVTDGYVTINPIDVTVEIVGEYNTTDYDGELHTVSGYTATADNDLYDVNDLTYSGDATAERTDVGTTNMGLEESDFTNTNANFATVTLNITDGYQAINAIDVTVEIVGAYNTSDYDGELHEVTGYTVTADNDLYDVNDLVYSGDARAERTDAGITYMGLAESDFTNTNANFATVTLIISDGYQTVNPIDVTVTIEGANNTTDYDGELHTVSGYTATADNDLYDVNDLTYSGDATAERTDVGTTNMGLEESDFENTNANFATVTLNITDGYQAINAIDVTVEIVGEYNTSDYDGELHAVTGYTATADNDLYDVNDLVYSGDARAERADAGITYMGLEESDFTNTNANFATVTLNITDGYQAINAIDVTVEIVGEYNTTDYDGELHAVTGYTATADNDLYDVNDLVYSGDARAERADAGITYMGLEESDFTNTNANFATVTLNITDGYQAINAIDVTVEIVGEYNTSDYDGELHAVTGYTATADNDLYDVNDLVYSGDARAERADAGITYMGLEESDFTNTNANFATVTLNISDGYQTIEPIDVIVTVVGEQNTTVYDGEWHSVESWSISADNDLYDLDFDISYYCNPYASQQTVGTTNMSLGETCFENNNNNFNVTFNVTDGYQEITAREVTVSVEDKVVTFNGVEQYGNTEYTFTNLVSGHDATITYTPSHGTAASTTPYDNGEFSGGFQVMNGSTDVTGNYTLVTQTAGKLTITAPDAVVVTITGNYTTVDYDGAEHEASGYTVSISNPSYTADDFSFSGTDYVARTDAGTTYMELEGKFENLNPAFTDVTFEVTDGYVTVNPIDVTVTIEGANNTTDYDGELHTVSGYTATADNDLYDVNDLTYSGDATAERTDVGTTNMGLEESDFENTNPNFATVTLIISDGYQTIEPIDVTVTIEGANNTTDYDGELHTVSGYTATADNDLYDVNDLTYSGDATAERADAGITYMGLEESDFTNTNANFATVTLNITDGYQAINAIDVTVEIVGEYNTSDYDGELHEVTGYTATADNDLYDVNDLVYSGDARAERADAGITYMGLEESDFTNTNANFATVTLNITDGYQAINAIDVTVNVLGEQNTTAYDGQWHSVETYSATCDNSLYDVDNDMYISGCNPYASRQDVGITYMSLGEGCFENYNNNFNVTFIVEDGYVEITRVAITIKADNKTKVYDNNPSTDPVLTATVTDVPTNGVAPVYSLERESGQEIGTYNITVIAEEDANPNYTITTEDGTFSIVAPDAIIVTVTGHCDTVSYDGMSHVVEGYDVVSIEIGGVPTTIYTEADFEYTVPTLIEETNVGSYNMGLDPANFNNLNTTFNVTFVVEKDGNLKINPNQDPITVTITGHNNTVGYNGSEHQVSGYDVTISGSTLYTEADFEFIGTENDSIAKGTNASSSVYEMNLSDSKFQNINTNFTNVEFVVANGFIRILPQNVTVTITCKETTKPYNGHIQSALDYEYTISPETTDFTFSMLQITSRDSASGVNVGTYDGVLLFDYLGSDENYEVMVVHQNICKLTITPVDLTIIAVDQSYPFNGSVQGPGDVILSDPVDIAQYISIPGDGLKGGDYLYSIEVDGQSPSPAIGTYSNYLVPSHATFMTALFEENGEVHPIPENYNITYVNGAIIITDPSLMNLTITASSDNKVYDGTPLTNDGYTNTELAAGDHIESVTVTGSQTVVGTSDNVPSAAVIKNAVGEDVTSSYNITYVNGTLVVETREVTVSVADNTTEYNGSEQYGNSEYTFANVVSGQTATIDYTPSYGTLVNTYDNGVYDVSSFTVVDASDNDVTSNYTLVDWTAGKLTVTDRTIPYEITMTSKSNSAPITYDGLEHSIDEFVTHTFTVDGNTYTVSGLTASSEPQIFAGMYNNVIEGTPIVTDEYGNNVTDQFTVNTVEGTLTISKRLITFTIENPEDATKVYDGTPLTITFDKLHVDNLAETDELIDGTLTSSSAEVGEYTIEDGNMFYMMATGTFTMSGFKIKHSLYPSMLAKTLASYSASISLSGSITSIECAGVTYQGHPYEAVQIGTQCWLAENLRNTATAAGPISYVAYNEDDANAAAFGYLYTWYTAVGVPEGDNTTAPTTATTTSGETYVQGICPDGWAIPSHTDMEILKNFASGEVRRLRDMSTSYWISGSEGVTPNYNFNSRGGGFYNSVSGDFERMLLEAYYWESNSEPGTTEVKTLVDAYYCSDMLFQTSKRTDKRSVRCIRKQ